jgi:hypothetical protein
LSGGGGSFKHTTVPLDQTARGFRSYLSLPAPPKSLPLWFHRQHLSLRGLQIQEQLFSLLLAGFTVHMKRTTLFNRTNMRLFARGETLYMKAFYCTLTGDGEAKAMP